MAKASRKQINKRSKRKHTEDRTEARTFQFKKNTFAIISIVSYPPLYNHWTEKKEKKKICQKKTYLKIRSILLFFSSLKSSHLAYAIRIALISLFFRFPFNRRCINRPEIHLTHCRVAYPQSIHLLFCAIRLRGFYQTSHGWAAYAKHWLSNIPDRYSILFSEYISNKSNQRPIQLCWFTLFNIFRSTKPFVCHTIWAA